MKHVKAVISHTKSKLVEDAIEDKISNFCFLHGKGRMAKVKPTVRVGRGTRTMEAEYADLEELSVIVEDEHVEAVIKAITGAAYTGNSGDGYIIVAPIEKVVVISPGDKLGEPMAN